MIRVHVAWEDRIRPPKCCGNEMDKIGWEGQPIADQVKVTWSCPLCQQIVECFASIWTDTETYKAEIERLKKERAPEA